MKTVACLVFLFLLTHYARADSSMEDDGDQAKLSVTLLPDNRSAEVALEGSFGGYVIQARKSNEHGSLVLGEFAAGSDDSARTLTHPCGDRENVVISGRGDSKKATVTWQAPFNWTGAVIFRALVLGKREGPPRYVVSDRVVLGTAPNTLQSAASIRNAAPSQADQTPRTTDSPVVSPGVAKRKHGVAKHKSLRKDDGHEKDDGEDGGDGGDGGEDDENGGEAEDQGCGETKGCFGFPDGCIGEGDCKMLVTFVAEEDGYHFELSGPADEEQFWIAAGISETSKMELTSVVECLHLGGDKTLLRESWNSEGTTNKVMAKTTEGITLGSHGVADGELKCTWVRKAVTTVNGVTFDLAKMKYFVLLATGKVIPPDVKSYHSGRMASKEKLSFGEKRVVKAGSDRDPLILVHGNLMILAWLYLVSLAILIARNFKPSWEGSLIMGDKVWFFLHRGLMVTAVLTILTSVAVIFYTTGGWSFSGNLHPIFGITAVILGVCQPIMALFLTTIVFATGLKKANLGGSKWFIPILALFVTFYVVVQVVFQIQRSMTQSPTTTGTPMVAGRLQLARILRGLLLLNLRPSAAAEEEPKKEAAAEPPAPGGGPQTRTGPPQVIPPATLGAAPQGTAVAGQSQEGEGFRKVLLAIYAVVSLVLASILCAIVCTSAPK
ncbi:hypothetical protein MTO96_015719 [Rhipicephalus appendiculatus]